MPIGEVSPWADVPVSPQGAEPPDTSQRVYSSSKTTRWYDGYLIGPGPEPIHVYNPNSVARSIGSGHFSNYWTSTETYEALRVY
ncbi:MAG: hypothetical protein J6D54_00085, partial [Olsenella sp.]|nr:hypothetical protein [Olsenella sp.]